MLDAIIIGGGPAGMSAALILARCLRKIILFDSGSPRNRWADQMNGFLTRDGLAPDEFLKMAKQDLEKYKVHWENKKIIDAKCMGDYFEVCDEDNNLYQSKKLLIATGLKDTLPKIDGIEAFYGKSVHHCPYCDGYENRGKELIAFGKGSKAKGLALSLTTWSKHVTLCTEGVRISKASRDLLERNGVKIITSKIEKLIGKEGHLEEIQFQNKQVIRADAMFFVDRAEQQSLISHQLKCDFTEKGVVTTDNHQRTKIKGLYVAGDADRDMQQVIVAAAEGAKAAISINKELQEEERK